MCYHIARCDGRAKMFGNFDLGRRIARSFKFREARRYFQILMRQDNASMCTYIYPGVALRQRFRGDCADNDATEGTVGICDPA